MIIGTAGHVDHGKTELIRALTGIDTDRLREEKERGISIDLGFAPFNLTDGRVVGVVDVPGHEKFIHNMLAGVGGLDLVLLVIDAAEGVMPQTREHLDILELLQVKRGLVVITKMDLVEKEWLEMVEEEVREVMEGSFLADAPIYFVSSVTKEGIEELRQAIEEIAAAVPGKDSEAPLRIPLDRVFSVSGFGTVITGTLLSGKVRTGQTVELLPPGKEFRVRGVQVHGEMVEKAEAGQRVALNLVGLEKAEVIRGSVIADPGFFCLTRFCDTKLKMLSTAARPLTNMSPVHFYLGTARVVARTLLLGSEELKPGQEGFVQCRLDRPLVAHRGDRFIIRSYSPMITIGGGIILDENPRRHKRFRNDVLGNLVQLEKEDLSFVLQRLKEKGVATLEALSQRTKIGPGQLQKMLNEAVQRGDVVLIGGFFSTPEIVREWESAVIEELERFHRERPLQPGLQKASLAGALPYKLTGKAYDELLKHIEEKGLLVLKGDLVLKSDFTPRPSAAQEKKIVEILEIFAQGDLNPPSLKEIWEKFGFKKEEVENLVYYMVEEGHLMKITEEFYLHKDTYSRCLQALIDFFQNHESITLGQYRDLLQTSRRRAQALLEHFDGCKYTRRQGDERVPLRLPRGE